MPGCKVGRAGPHHDKAGHETDRPEAGHDKNAKSPAGDPSAFQSALPPGGGREGGSPSGIVIVVERFPPYNEYSDE